MSWKDKLQLNGSFLMETSTEGSKVQIDHTNNNSHVLVGLGGARVMKAKLTREQATQVAHALLSFSAGLM